MFVRYDIAKDRFFVSSNEHHNEMVDRKIAIDYSRYIPIDISLEDTNEYLCHFPHEVCIEITNKCNYSCPICIAESNYRKNDYLSLESLSSIIDDLPKQVTRLTLTGGEPCLHPEIEQIVNLVKQKGLSIVLSTNGFYTDKINSLLRKCGTIVVAFSLHGTSDIHDNYVAVKGAFLKTIKSIELAIQYSCYVHIYSIASQLTIEHLPDLISFLERYEIVEHRINTIKMRGRVEQEYADFSQIRKIIYGTESDVPRSIKRNSNPFLFVDSSANKEVRCVQ